MAEDGAAAKEAKTSSVLVDARKSRCLMAVKGVQLTVLTDNSQVDN